MFTDLSITQTRAFNAIIGGFVADAAAVGLHWIYDQEELKKIAQDKPEFHDPSTNRYHCKRKLGQLSCYGDQALIALQSVAAHSELNLEDYRQRLMEQLGSKDYAGYLDEATKQFLATGRGANANEAGCLAKIPVFTVACLDRAGFPKKIEQAIRITHDNDEAVMYGVAAAQILRAVIERATPGAAIAKGAATKEAVRDTMTIATSGTKNHLNFAKQVGQDASLPHVFPVALHAALNCADFPDVVRQSILAGGDSCGRLFLAGPIRAAYQGIGEDWIDMLEQKESIASMAQQIVGALSHV